MKNTYFSGTMCVALFFAALFFLGSGCSKPDVPDKMDNEKGPVITAVPHFGDAPLTVDFDAGQSNMYGGDNAYFWDFDDGNPAEGVTSRHTFSAPGTYMVTLTVNSSTGRSDSAWVAVVVN